MLTCIHGLGNNNRFHKPAILAEKEQALFYLSAHQKKPTIYGFFAFTTWINYEMARL